MLGVLRCCYINPAGVGAEIVKARLVMAQEQMH